jgi:hypothetical protein
VGADGGPQGKPLRLVDLDDARSKRILAEQSGNQQEELMKRRTVASVAVAVLGLGGMAVSANVLLRFSPELGGGPPFYARIELVDGQMLAHHDATWTAITFYRDPAGVPGDFDLLQLFDAPRAFDVPMVIEGFEIWRNGPWAGDASPIEVSSYGLGAVPIWFVRWDELQSTVNANDRLTVADLESLPSLIKGSASRFKEVLHPFQSAVQTKTQIEASGTLPDGRSFAFQAEETHNRLNHVRIAFK